MYVGSCCFVCTGQWSKIFPISAVRKNENKIIAVFGFLSKPKNFRLDKMSDIGVLLAFYGQVLTYMGNVELGNALRRQFCA